MSDIDIDHLRTWIGREQTVADELSPFKARALAAAFEREHLPASGDALPPAWQWLYFVDTPRASATGSDGHPRKGGFMPPVPLPRRMWAAGEFTVHCPLRLGQPATRRSTIESVDLKSGKSGALVFVNLRHEIFQHGEYCLSEIQNIVYRDMPSGPAPLPNGSPPGEIETAAPHWSRTIDPDPVLLFRFSALTYNGHRIHYDRDYARDVEFYAGLVVHGPLLATLLAESVASLPEAPAIRQFRFRAQRPTLDDGPFTVNGHRNGDEISLWSATHDGFTGMTATAIVVDGATP